MDPISALAGGVTIGRGALEALEFVRSKVADADVIAAMFDSDAKRLEGDGRIAVQRIVSDTAETPEPTVFWYRVVKVAGFAFVPVPLHPNVEVLFGQEVGERLGVDIWRWVAPARSGTVVGGGSSPPNVAVDFIVVGYRPKALVRHFAKGPPPAAR